MARAAEQQMQLTYAEAQVSAKQIEEKRRYLKKLADELEAAQKDLKACDEYAEVQRLKDVIADIAAQVVEDEIRLTAGLANSAK